MMDADHLAIVGQDDKVSQNGSRTVRASDVHPISIDWLWEDYVPRGMTSIFGGFPGVGKSTILYDLAARTSCEGKVVLIVTAEDHIAAVVRPRLEAAGADLELVRIVTIPITLPDDVAVLDSLVRDYDAALLVLDPLVAFIGDGVNTHRDHHVRRVLAPLADLAERTGVALVVVIHTNKGRDNEPLMRISGSIGFTGAARTVLLAADDPKDETRRIFAVVKSNLAEFPPPLAYRVVGVQLEGGISTSRIEWLGQAPEIDVRELLVSRNPDDRSAREDAVEFLVEAGVQETAQPVADLMKGAKAMEMARRRFRGLVERWGSQRGVLGSPIPGCGDRRLPPKWTPHLDTYHLSSCPVRFYLRKQAQIAPNWTRKRVRGHDQISSHPVPTAAGVGSTATPRTVRPVGGSHDRLALSE
jgi:hypothetical protein